MKQQTGKMQPLTGSSKAERSRGTLVFKSRKIVNAILAWAFILIECTT
jgi:hypothetical protein